MPKPIWGNLPQLVINAPTARAVTRKQSPQISQILNEVSGTNLGAISIVALERNKMKPLFKGFNPEQIAPKELSRIGSMLYQGGYIDNHTVELLSRTGAEFDKKGKVVDADKEINALEFFAERISEMKDKASIGDPYARLLLPDYVKAIHILQNLQTFATTPSSVETTKLKRAPLIKNL
ncbi:hypothetical protein ALQ04_03791 [Pseudomonas cichorii]|uniref:Uncharacterized protein n=1 Tax=Pseudomonas cichorii TaxID=36746 RepID=A0A3M4LVM1_PSECI|nr:hypothetical protein [Pseudomonas cichorii]RMQ45569.1 hypothetical protein ALQ04_03791 [Pseudomonas cichorii]